MKITRILMIAALAFGLMLMMSAEARVKGTPARFEGALKTKEIAAPGTCANGYGYIYFNTSGVACSKNDAGTVATLGTTDTLWGTGVVTTNIVTAVSDQDILLCDGGILAWGDANPGTVETILSDISAGVLMIDGGAAYSGELLFQEDTSNGTNYIGIAPPQSVAADYVLILPPTAPADKSIFYTSATSTMATDATNFAWDDSSNANRLVLGAGTGAGTITLLEGSGGGTDKLSITAPATLAADIEYTFPNALPTTAGNFLAVGTTGTIAQQPAEVLLYSQLTPATTLDGTTAAATTLTPATSEGTATVPIALELVGGKLDWDASLTVGSDADGDETLTLIFYLGAQAIGTSGAIATDGASTWRCTGSVKIKSAGSGGTGTYQAMFANGVVIPVTSGAVFTSFDCTATHAFTVTADWSGTTDAQDTVILNDLNLSYNNVD